METEGMTPQEQARLAEAQSRVDRGVKVLDAGLGPVWVHRVDLNDLDMASAYSCVAAQLFGGYNDGVEALWPDAVASEPWATPYCCTTCHGTEEEFAARQAEHNKKPLRDDLARSHGFLGDNEDEIYYDDLQDAWTATIERLRQERPSEGA